MSEETFEAITANHNDIILFTNDPKLVDFVIPNRYVPTLRAFFQAERDKQLGRWRDPKTPNFVTYHSDIEYVRVVNEATGTSDKAWRDDPRPLSTAKRYFAAHPGPRPWHDAKPGEVWVISFEDEEYLGIDTPACVRKGPNKEAMFDVGATYIESVNPCITAGRRIWPEEEADDE